MKIAFKEQRKGGFMNKKSFPELLLQEERLNKKLQNELKELDQLLRQAGFSEGIETIKEVAEELLGEKNIPDSQKEG